MVATREQVDATQARLAQHYLERVRVINRAYKQGGESAVVALAFFDQDRDQILRAQAWATAHAEHDAAAAAVCNRLPLVGADVLYLRLELHELHSWLEAAAAVARRIGDRRVEATHLLNLSEFWGVYADFEQARLWIQRALGLAHTLGDKPLEARGRYLLGYILNCQGNLSASHTALERSLALYQSIGDQDGIADALHQLAMSTVRFSNVRLAQEYLEQSLAIRHTLGDQRKLAVLLNDLGFVTLSDEQHAAAHDYIEQSFSLARHIGDREQAAFLLLNRAWLALDQGDAARASEDATLCVAEYRAMGHSINLGLALYVLAITSRLLGDLPAARASGEESLALCRAARDVRYLPLSLTNLAMVYLRLRRQERARALLREGITLVASSPAASAGVDAEIHLLRAAVLVGAEGDPTASATWLGLIENRPLARAKTPLRVELRAERPALEAALSPAAFAAARERGKALDLDTVMAEIARDLGA